jgi:molybdopterin-guanine dinucleotide biosynthesis protein A
LIVAELTGVVLAGGESRRMGHDKASLIVCGHPLLRTVVERVAVVTDEVIVASSRHNREEWPHLPATFIEDATPGRGPLAGLQAGLRAARSDHVLLVACDMPFLSLPLLRALRDHRPECDAFVPRIGSRWHPLHGIYSRSCLTAIDRLLLEDRASLRELLSAVQTREVPPHLLRLYDPEGLSFFNLNYPTDCERARSAWPGNGSPFSRPAFIA